MNHLKENNVSYFQHLRFAWSVAFILLVHGVFPNVWQTKASDILCSKDHE